MSNNFVAQPASWKIWWLAARPRTWPAAIVPVFVGSAIAARAGQFQVLPFLAALLASLLIQIGTNYANDLFDYLKGAEPGFGFGLKISTSFSPEIWQNSFNYVELRIYKQPQLAV